MPGIELEKDGTGEDQLYRSRPPPRPHHPRDQAKGGVSVAGFSVRVRMETPTGNLVALVVKVMLVTCQRKGEVVSARWDDIDCEAKVWTIPAERTKNGQAHRVPLSAFVLDLLAEAGKKTGKEAHVFHSARIGAPFTPSTINTALLRSLDVLGVKNFTPHDLRRTGASHMTSMGIPRLSPCPRS